MDEADPQTVTSVTIPLLNPNEPEALLAALHIHEGQHIRAGDLLATLETTKSAAELAAEQEGFVAGLHREQGATVRAGRSCVTSPLTPIGLRRWRWMNRHSKPNRQG